jgi:hypothetical protein
LSSCTIGGFSRRAQLLEVSSVNVVYSRYNAASKMEKPCSPLRKKRAPQGLRKVDSDINLWTSRGKEAVALLPEFSATGW